MSDLEQNIVNLLPLLSEEAKRKARFVLGDEQVVPKKGNQKFDVERANLIISKYLK